jgi:hypothetical protein
MRLDDREFGPVARRSGAAMESFLEPFCYNSTLRASHPR